MSRQTALITGASRGIGRELALLLARGGYETVLVARSQDDLEEVADLVRREFGTEAVVIPQDLSRPNAARMLCNRLEEREIAVDILINNAAVGAHGRMAELEPSTTFDMLQLNVVALTQLTRYLMEGMLERKSGRILNVASTAAFQPGPLMAVYYASKAYVLSFSEALAEELRDTPVSATALVPGLTNTEFQKRAGMGGTVIGPGWPLAMDPESVARAGYRGLMEEKDIVVPGIVNKIHFQALRLAPRRLITRLVRWLQERR